MDRSISFLLKLFAIIFWYFVVVFVLTIISLKTGRNFLQFTIRGYDYRWDYEAMFSAVYLVWGIFLWKAANAPSQHSSFIRFTIWANIFHAVVMTIVGLLRPGEFSHLL